MNKNQDIIRRYLVQRNWGGGWRNFSTHRSRDLAISDKERHPKATTRIKLFELHPNQHLRAFGIDRYDRLLTDILNDGLQLRGSLEDLIECGAIGSYIRDVIGKSGCKSSCDEYGNYYDLRKRGKRYELSLYLHDEPRTPHPNAVRKLGLVSQDPLETDISEILERVRSQGSAA